MKTSQLILKVIIALSIIAELFVLIAIFNIAQTKSNGGDTITFAQNTQINGQDLTKGTYVMTQEGFVKLKNYWLYNAKIFTIAIPLLIFLASLFILNKKKKSDNTEPIKEI
jgi:hypothetical protein